MESFIIKLQDKLDTITEGLEKQFAETIIVAKKSYENILPVIKELNDFQFNYKFIDNAEEIKFFKKIKPLFIKELVYHNEVFQLEYNKPLGSRNKQRNYFKSHLNHYQAYIERHRNFYNYIQLNEVQNDVQYFTIGNSDCENDNNFVPDLNSNITTQHSHILANLLAYEHVSRYLNQQIGFLGKVNLNTNPIEIKPRQQNSWTDSKVALIELAYALYAKGSINFGEIEIKQIITALEDLFNIKLGNFYRVYMDMLIRKKGRTPYIDSLKEYLERRMDEAE